jgi:hypothetical protein
MKKAQGGDLYFLLFELTGFEPANVRRYLCALPPGYNSNVLAKTTFYLALLHNVCLFQSLTQDNILFSKKTHHISSPKFIYYARNQQNTISVIINIIYYSLNFSLRATHNNSISIAYFVKSKVSIFPC